MTILDNYLATLREPEKSVVEHMYAIVRQTVPMATEETYYALPSFKYHGRGLIAIVANKTFISLYPFCAIDRLGLDLAEYERTKGSVHFTPSHPISDDLLRHILTQRIKQIDL